MNFLIIPLMSILARASGGGLFANKVWSRLPEILFAVPFAYANYIMFDIWWLATISFLVSFLAMEMGHGTFYRMTGYNQAAHPRKQTIEYAVRPVYQLFSKNINHPAYSWACMAFKGLLIALPLGVYAPLLAVMWPVSYYVGMRLEDHSYYAEYLSGMAAGTVILMAIGV